MNKYLYLISSIIIITSCISQTSKPKQVLLRDSVIGHYTDYKRESLAIDLHLKQNGTYMSSSGTDLLSFYHTGKWFMKDDSTLVFHSQFEYEYFQLEITEGIDSSIIDGEKRITIVDKNNTIINDINSLLSIICDPRTQFSTPNTLNENPFLTSACISELCLDNGKSYTIYSLKNLKANNIHIKILKFPMHMTKPYYPLDDEEVKIDGDTLIFSEYGKWWKK